MKYQRVILHIEQLIKNSTLKSGSKLPSIRLLANTLNCSNSTVIKAYEALEQYGVAYSIDKMGCFLVNNPQNILPSENIDFSSLKCDNNLLSFKEYQHALNHIMSGSKDYLKGNGEPEGLHALRDTLKKHFSNKKIFTNLHDIVITSGSQQAFNLILSTLLNPDDQIMIENPTYINFLNIVKQNSFKNNVFYFMRNEEEIDFNLVEFYFIKHNIKLLYITPDFQNPLSISMTLKEKIKLLELCYKFNVLIIEDNYLEDVSEFEEPQSLYSLDKNDMVFHVKSFSKVFSSSLRISALICPHSFTKAIVEKKIISDLHSPIIDQAVLEYFLSNKNFMKSKFNCFNIYQERMNILRCQFDKAEISDDFKIHIPAGGIFMFVEVPNKFNLQTMINDLQKQNIKIKSIQDNFYNEHHFKGFIISIASVSMLNIAKGASIIIDYLNNN